MNTGFVNNDLLNKHPEIYQASNTIISMCVDFQLERISLETFVSNLGLSAKWLKDKAEEARPAPKSAPKEAEEAQKHLTTAAVQNGKS